MKQIITLGILFYSLALFQTSFLVHFPLFGYVFPILIIAFLLINISEGADSFGGVISALYAGFFYEVFSQSPFGLWVGIFLFISLFIKFVIKHYVQTPIFQRI